MNRRLTRRAFLRDGCAAAAGACGLGALGLGGCGSGSSSSAGPAAFRPRRHPDADALDARVGLATGDDPAGLVRTALRNLLGPDSLRTCIRPGDRVAVKPNVAWDLPPESGANVHPEVVGALVVGALEAEAGEVRVFDNSIRDAARCYETSGMAAAARRAGGTAVRCAPHRFRTVRFGDDPRVRALGDWPIADEALDADVLINVAVAKTHNLTGVSLCMKNLMGVQGGDRGKMHPDIHRKLADLGTVVRPTLNILDAVRVLVAGGPRGGRPEYVVPGRTVLAGTSAVTVDAWAAGSDALPWRSDHPALADIPMIGLGAEAGLGVADPGRIEVVA